MTAAPFFLQSELVIFDADVTTICSVNISKTEELYTFPSRPSLLLPHTDIHSNTHTHPHTPTPEKRQHKKGRLKQQNQIQWRWPLQWSAGCPVGTVLKPKATVAKLFVNEMCREMKWLLKNQWKEFYFKEIKVVDWYNANNFQKSPMPF